MAWFESSFSSIKGQLSNLTKEVKDVLTQPDTDEEDKEDDESTDSSRQQASNPKDNKKNNSVKHHETDAGDSKKSKGKKKETSVAGSSGDSPEHGTFNADDCDDGWDVEGWAVHDSFHVPSSPETGQRSSEIDELRAEVQQLREEKQQLTQTVSALETELETITQIVAKNNRNARQFEELQAEVTRLQSENGRLNREKLELEQIVAASQDENSNLSTGLELDLQYQRDLEELIAAKDSTQRKYNQLKEDYDLMKSQFEEFRQIRVKTTSTASQSSYDCASVLSQTQDEAHPVLASTSSQTATDNLSASSQTVSNNPSTSSQTAGENSSASSQTVNDNPSISSQTVHPESSFAASQTVAESETPARKHADSESSEEECSFRDLKNVLDSVPFKIPEQYHNRTHDDGSRIIQDIKALTCMCLNLQENEKKLAAELMEKNEEVYVLKTKMEEATKKLSLVEEELADFETRESEWEKAEQNRNQEISRLTSLHEEAKKNLMKELKDKQSKIEELSQQNQELLSNIEELKNVSKSSGDFEELRTELLNKLADRENQIVALTEARTDLESEVRLLNDHVKDLTYRLQMSEATTLNQNNLETETNNLKHGLESAKRTIITLNEQLSSASIDINKKTEEITELNQTLQQLSQDLESQNEDKRNFTEEITVLKQSLASKEQELKSAEEDFTELKLSHEKKDRELCKYILEEKQLKDELASLKEKYDVSESENLSLRTRYEALGNEISSLRENVSHVEDMRDELEKQTERLEESQSLGTQFSELKTNHDKLIDENNRLNELIEQKECELDNLRESATALQDFAKKCQDYEEVSEKFNRLSVEHNKLTEENNRLNEVVSQKLSEIDSLKNSLLDLDNLRLENEKLNKTISDLKLESDESLSSLRLDIAAKAEELVSLKSTAESYDALKARYSDLEKVKGKLETDVNNLMSAINEKDSEISNLKKMGSTTNQTVLEEVNTLKSEKEQLIQSLQVKHSESVGYHNELQRISGLLSQELAEKQELEKVVKGMREQLSSTEKAIQARDKEIDSLREQTQTLQSQLEYVSQLLRVADRQEAEGEPDVKQKASDSNDRNQILQKIEVLQEEKNNLSCALEAEQNKCKTMFNALREEKEKNSGLKNDLERLKSHLVSVEDTYTQELMNAEQQIAELQTRLSSADERVKSSTTAYTSASIRANQQVESLTNQVKLLTEQREQIQQKLNEAEDRVQSHAASLTNLQVVLEQFQIDKEKDIMLATERIQENLQAAYRKNNQLCSEISTLQAQLSEANEGLKAAARFTDQLNAKSRTIESLEKQVSDLKQKLGKAEAEIDAVSRGTESKIDRCLVKNLVVGHLTAPGNGRAQALSVLATVLDMSKEERQRVGLEPGGNESHFRSLSEAFIKFLENESQPQNVLKMIPENKSATNVTAHRRSPSGSVLLSEASLPNIPQFPVNRNSGAILKDVMKNDR